MAIATTYTVDHACGHTQDHDLTTIAAGQRRGRADWLATTDCKDCWAKSGGKKLSKEVEAERAAEHQAAAEHAERDKLPGMVGTDKQLDWAFRVRYELLRDAYNALVTDGELSDAEYESSIMEPARRVDRARWWIDNRDIPSADLPELLADTGLDPAAVTTENPF